MNAYAGSSLRLAGPSVARAAIVVLVVALFGSAFATDDHGTELNIPDTRRTFRDTLRSGDRGPEMVVIPPGRFRMGCDRGSKRDCPPPQRPARQVRIASPFAMSKYEMTFDDYDRYLKAKGGGRSDEAHDHGWGRGRRPVINITRTDALDYMAWLSAQTGARYRLPSEAEWEYAARAGTETDWPWGDEFVPGRANCWECGSRWDGERTAPVGSFPPNAWGLHDMHGNVMERLLDCWHSNYGRAPTDGSARTVPQRGADVDDNGDCTQHVVRGGAWITVVPSTRSSKRLFFNEVYYGPLIGFRVVRELDGASEQNAQAARGRVTRVAALAE